MIMLILQQGYVNPLAPGQGLLAPAWVWFVLGVVIGMILMHFLERGK